MQNKIKTSAWFENSNSSCIRIISDVQTLMVKATMCKIRQFLILVPPSGSIWEDTGRQLRSFHNFTEIVSFFFKWNLKQSELLERRSHDRILYILAGGFHGCGSIHGTYQSTAKSNIYRKLIRLGPFTLIERIFYILLWRMQNWIITLDVPHVSSLNCYSAIAART